MSNGFYKGRYTPINPSKYEGDPTNIVHRSLWERVTFKWADTNPNVLKWMSEEIVVPYICKTDGKAHRYYVDLKLRMANGKTYLIEIKPKCETVPPIEPKRKTRRYIIEVMTYAKNISKWEAADKFAKSRGWEFQVWHEDTLKNLGIRLLTT